MIKRLIFSIMIIAAGCSSMAGNIFGFNATQSGDTVKVIPGKYGNTYVSQPPITGRRIVINAAGSVFTGTLFLPDAFQDCDFINFTFSNVGNECIRWSPNTVTEKAGVQAKNISFKNCTADKCGAFTLWGTYSDIAAGKSLSQNIEFSNLTITNSLTNQVFFLTKSYGLVCHDIKILNTGTPAYDSATSHDGIFFLRWSDGEFYNNTIRGHMGNGWRIYPSGIANGTRGLVKIHDNFVADGRKHSAVETNGNNSPAGYNADIYITNNTFGNLAAGNYHCGGISVYPEPSGSKVYFENNVVFNTDINDVAGGVPPAMKLIFTDTGTKTDSNVNNWYWLSSDQAGVDMVTGKLLPTAPQYGNAGAWMYQPVPVVKTIKSVTITYSDGSTETKP